MLFVERNFILRQICYWYKSLKELDDLWWCNIGEDRWITSTGFVSPRHDSIQSSIVGQRTSTVSTARSTHFVFCTNHAGIIALCIKAITIWLLKFNLLFWDRFFPGLENGHAISEINDVQNDIVEDVGPLRQRVLKLLNSLCLIS